MMKFCYCLRRQWRDASFTTNLIFSVVSYEDGNEDGYIGEKEEEVFDYRNDRYFTLYPKLEANSCQLEYKGSKVYLFDTPNNAITESFVNGGCTSVGGVHVNIWRQLIYRTLHNISMKRFPDKLISKKTNKIKSPTDKGLEKLYGPHISMILSCILIEPGFSSQAKEELIGPVPVIPKSLELAKPEYKTKDNKDSNGFDNWRIFQEIENALDAKAKRKEGNKRRTEFVDIKDAEDAEWAGTKKSDQCALIVCEGLSGKTTATKGAFMINPKAYGIYPLKGKVANLYHHPKAHQNIIDDIKKLLGYAPGKSRNQLRYNRMFIMTDADPDGIHIRLLIVLMILQSMPDLAKEPGFVEAFVFPIIILSKRGQKLAFYTTQEYEQWAQDNENGRGWTARYFKGLGTCTEEDIKYIFNNPKIVGYVFDEDAETALKIAFAKGKGDEDRNMEDERKVWLRQYNPKELFFYPNLLNISTSVIKELPIYSIYHTQRSIPMLMDGLTLGQRKVVHIVRKKNYTTSVKVSDLSGVVSGSCAYHHSGLTLEDIIIRMNYTFAGSNNLPLLKREGEFGSRAGKGTDAVSSGRYPYCRASPILKVLFTDEDDSILEWRRDGGEQIEPTYFYSIIALILANRQEGIGTGYNCNIPCYNPRELLRRHRLFCEGVKRETSVSRNISILNPTVLSPLLPWARYYKGTITLENGKVIDRGVFERHGGQIHVTEVPLSLSYDDYQHKLKEMKASYLGEKRVKLERTKTVGKTKVKKIKSNGKKKTDNRRSGKERNRR